MSQQCRVTAASPHSTCRVSAASQARQTNCAASMPRHGRVKTHSCRVTAASIRLCRVTLAPRQCRVTLAPRQCRVKPAHQHLSALQLLV
ncbi:hypothetical protein P692DRAFT_201794243 [Suillus brevipes Sb2]|nr:hypothetical protein P692DRAFT_201794243 [Suillus brevipes Sb2]